MGTPRHVPLRKPVEQKVLAEVSVTRFITEGVERKDHSKLRWSPSSSRPNEWESFTIEPCSVDQSGVRSWNRDLTRTRHPALPSTYCLPESNKKKESKKKDGRGDGIRNEPRHQPRKTGEPRFFKGDLLTLIEDHRLDRFFETLRVMWLPAVFFQSTSGAQGGLSIWLGLMSVLRSHHRVRSTIGTAMCDAYRPERNTR